MVSIRPATAEDVPTVLPMVKSISEWHAIRQPAIYALHKDYLQTYGSWLVRQSTEPRSVFLVAEADDGSHVGFLIATTEGDIPIYKPAEHGFVHDIWVEEAYRHEGIARQMMMLAIESFSQRGIWQLRLDTIHDNIPAQRLFASCGMLPRTLSMSIELPEAPGTES